MLDPEDESIPATLKQAYQSAEELEQLQLHVVRFFDDQESK